MLGSYQRLSLLSTLLFSSVATANRFAFSVQNISVHNTVDRTEDDLTLAIVASAPSANFSTSYPLGSFKDNSNITWDNLTLEIDLGATLTNFSVVFSVVNAPDAKENQTNQLVSDLLDGAATITSLVPIPGFAIASSVIDLVNGLFSVDCSGPGAVGNKTYVANSSSPSVSDIDRLEKDASTCTAETFVYDPPSRTCGISSSNYTVSYCLTRLDEKVQNAAGVVSPQSFVGLAGIIAAVVLGAYV